jgi:hypothetical protein
MNLKELGKYVWNGPAEVFGFSAVTRSFEAVLIAS